MRASFHIVRETQLYSARYADRAQLLNSAGSFDNIVQVNIPLLVFPFPESVVFSTSTALETYIVRLFMEVT